MDKPAQKAADSFCKIKNLNNTGFVMIRLKAEKCGFIASNVLNQRYKKRGISAPFF
jgi:hypothetical protein